MTAPSERSLRPPRDLVIALVVIALALGAGGVSLWSTRDDRRMRVEPVPKAQEWPLRDVEVVVPDLSGLDPFAAAAALKART